MVRKDVFPALVVLPSPSTPHRANHTHHGFRPVIIDFLNRLFGLPVTAEPLCSGEIDSAAAEAAGLSEWLPEFEPGCHGGL